MLFLVQVILTLWVSWARGQESACYTPRIANSNFVADRSKYRLGDSITYSCRDGFYPSSQENTTECTAIGWDPPPRCSFKSCDFPEIKHGCLHREEARRLSYPVPVGAWYYYSCDENYVTASEGAWYYITCKTDGWTLKLPCPNLPCGSPPPVQNTFIPDEKPRYRHGDTARYQCRHPLGLFGNAGGTCLSGKWTDPPECKDSAGKCGPPPVIDNGNTTTYPSAVYTTGSSVEYQCHSYYLLDGNRTIMCRDGEWSEPPKCLDPCVIVEEAMKQHNIKLKWSDKKILYSRTNDYTEFKCLPGYRAVSPASAFRAQCREGKMEYPTCA